MATAILGLRRDLRLADNESLRHALAHAERVIPVYVHNPTEDKPWAPGAASRWWLGQSLRALDESLRRRGSRLVVRSGPSIEVLPETARETAARLVCWNRLYEPHRGTRRAGRRGAARRQLRSFIKEWPSRLHPAARPACARWHVAAFAAAAFRRACRAWRARHAWMAASSRPRASSRWASTGGETSIRTAPAAAQAHAFADTAFVISPPARTMATGVSRTASRSQSPADR
jgi:deoxyribodipyrimidine photo-lyase